MGSGSQNTVADGPGLQCVRGAVLLMIDDCHHSVLPETKASLGKISKQQTGTPHGHEMRSNPIPKPSVFGCFKVHWLRYFNGYFGSVSLLS